MGFSEYLVQEVVKEKNRLARRRQLLNVLLESCSLRVRCRWIKKDWNLLLRVV
jgi:hypothetical protein